MLISLPEKVTDLDDNNFKFLQELRNRIPFLREIPDKVYFRLDTSEFYLPEGEVKQIRDALENELEHHVMTYTADQFNLEIPVYQHLCANLKPATLMEDQLQRLQDLENTLRSRGYNLSFSAYRKPLSLTDPYTSALAEFYLARGIPLS